MKSSLHPTRTVALVFFLAIVAGSMLLMLPVSRAEGGQAPWLVAFFTAVSAVCVTGLVVVDTGTYWSGFGQAVIMVLFQLGGFGMMTASTLLGLMVNRSLRLRTRLITQVETRALGLGDITGIARLVLIVTFGCELAIAIWLAAELHFGHALPWPAAAWSGLFHAVSAFNNAGFSIHADSLTRYAAAPAILLPVMLAIVVGGLGFPVLYDLHGKLREPRRWSLHSKLTLLGTALLLVLGLAGLMLFEWGNSRTLGPMPVPQKLLAAAFASVSARTAGFNAIDIGALTQESLALHYLLMFVGGGSASTAGGVKVGTIAILALLVIAEIRGRTDSEAFARRVSPSAQRQAITVLVLGSALITIGTLVILRLTNLPVGSVIFEVISAFGTVGLSTGITPELPPGAQLTLTVLMYAGRVGTITLAVSLAMGEHRSPYRYPEEHPIVG
ncbi:TrkH family potassium uptake protein [Cupriavidus neocaledonicus]|uniref:Potassium uptake protein, membrane component n=2 Tax=Cupriavidus neocaledonicus TaxID=1040979 RepID=A0A375HRL3_9BURK|nr:potassium transporter TrkG [Cupriavidus neocaledonicus]SOZ39826.1 putative potassium uptake protein, membrane component [Cupriavidus neocaledonicus]SPD60841.1 Trk system potassium uptake protein TrkH [Cupriavidus neocaledonicus]